MRIGERVLLILQQKKLKQADLATHLGISKSTINGWKQENRNPSSELIVPICEFLDISERYLLTGQEEDTSNSGADAFQADDDILELLKNYQVLDSRGKTMVKATAYRELERLEQNDPPQPQATITEDEEPIIKPPKRTTSNQAPPGFNGSDIGKSAGPSASYSDKRMML